VAHADRDRVEVHGRSWCRQSSLIARIKRAAILGRTFHKKTRRRTGGFFVMSRRRRSAAAGSRGSLVLLGGLLVALVVLAGLVMAGGLVLGGHGVLGGRGLGLRRGSRSSLLGSSRSRRRSGLLGQHGAGKSHTRDKQRSNGKLTDHDGEPRCNCCIANPAG